MNVAKVHTIKCVQNVSGNNMWNWDQGRLDYFQFDNLKKIARFALESDLRKAGRDTLVPATGLPFLPEHYHPWRNYSRVFRLSMICAQKGSGAEATPIAKLLASDGAITTDEYFHFLAEATSDPSPALQGWDYTATLRYPLLFSLKYLLARCALGLDTTEISQIAASYEKSGYIGDEDQSSYINLINKDHDMSSVPRQAAESIQVIAQISYLSLDKRTITVSLAPQDALNIFEQLSFIGGAPLPDGADEVFRLTSLFQAAIDELELDYDSTVLSDVADAGFSEDTEFAEGKKIRKTHLVIERNGKIRKEFFKANPTAACDMCALNTHQAYPWVERVLDIHHLLPLCSGARTSKSGTLLDDLVALCPTCHRAVHRFYDGWLKDAGKKDFVDSHEARMVYEEAKSRHEAKK